MRLFKSKFVSSFLIFTLILVASGFLSNYAHAASLTGMSDTMSREKIAPTTSSQVIKFTVATTMVASQTITVTWPSDFTNTSAVFGDVSMTYGASGTNATCTIAATPSTGQTCGAVWSTAGNRLLTLTMPSSAWTTPILATDKIIITIGSTHEVNPSTPGSYTISLATSAGDAGSLAVPIIGAGGTTDENEIITATVTPSITFTNDDSSIGFGALSSTLQTYANGGATGTSSDTTANTLAITTNAPSGYTLTYNGANLTSGSNTIPAANGTTTIVSSATGTTGTGQFAISAVAPASGAGTITSGYLNVGSASDSWKFVPGTTTTLASVGTAISATDSIAMHYLANIPSTTPAGAYSTTLTYIVTGNF